jgi:hypothetical protein
LAILDLPRQMSALQAVREELETALGGDENWRALQRTGASSGEADPDRRDRDARLVKALEANPLYLAWSNVGEAIDALRDADAGFDAEDETDAIELPEDIRSRIRVDAASGRPEPPADDAELPGEAVREEIGKGSLGHKLATIASLDPVAAPKPLAREDQAAAGQPTRAATSEGAALVRAQPGGDLPPLRTNEPAEAKVSFVRRQAPTVAAKAPTGADAQAAAGDNAFVPAAASAEEAEVAIVSTPVRRFLKALAGDKAES